MLEGRAGALCGAVAKAVPRGYSNIVRYSRDKVRYDLRQSGKKGGKGSAKGWRSHGSIRNIRKQLSVIQARHCMLVVRAVKTKKL